MARLSARTILVGLIALSMAACGGATDVDAPDAAEAAEHGHAKHGEAMIAPDLSPNGPPRDAPRVGMMSSLPLYWPLGADFAQLAQGASERPWARRVIEQRYRIEPLDTLSPIAPLTPGDSEVDPLQDLQRIAVVQPRGLSPADNVALDSWVRAGGALLLVLDPALTGHYEFALGDPRRPVPTALVPPLVGRWGLSVSFDESQPDEPRVAMIDGTKLPILLSGQWSVADPAAADCVLRAEDTIAICKVERGQVTLVADAAVFEHYEFVGAKGEAMLALLEVAFE